MNWRRWIRPGLVATVPLTLVALLMQQSAIERDLAGRAAARLAIDGQGWAAVEVFGRDVTIRGTAPTTESRVTAERAVAAVVGVRAVTNATQLLPVAAPFGWSARREGAVLTLAGSVPSEGIRASLLAAARRAVPRAEIEDRMALARGAPTAFNTGTSFALTRLGGLSSGLATLTDSTLAVSGVAADQAAFEDARTAFANDVPAGVDLGPVDILPARAERFVWSVNYDGNVVTTSGYVPNELVRRFLKDAARATLGDVTIVENVTVASGGPEGFAEAAGFAIALLAHMEHGGATLDGLLLDVAGVAESVDAYEALRVTLTGSLPPGVSVVADTIVPAPAAQYGWRGEIADGRVILSGYVPTPENRAELTALAETLFAGAAVEDRLRVASGGPRMDWIGAVKFAMGQLAQLGRGEVALAETAYSIRGEAADPDAYSAIAATNAGTLPASLELTDADVAPPVVAPYRFVAERRDGGVALGGFVPTDDGRQAIFAAARSGFGPAHVVDELRFAAGAPAGFVDFAVAAVRAVNRLAGGRVEIVDDAVTIEGVAYHEAAAADAYRTIAAALPDASLITRNDVITGQPGQPVSPERCREMLQGALQTGHIEFDGDQAVIAPHSLGVLDRVSAAIGRCPDAAVEIGAHADSSGSASANRTRTQARAEAIVDFIVGAGIKRERLTPVGYGESQPIADNGTEAGRAANRRIEFALAMPDGG